MGAHSLFDRIKPHIPALCVGAVAGAIITQKLSPLVTNRTNSGWSTGDAWFSEAIKKQLIEKGRAKITFKSGEFVDLIDWSHPMNDPTIPS